MSSEERINELTKRVEVLEAAEKKRIAKRKFKIAYEITKIVIVLILLLGGYLYINAKIIRPYKEAVNSINDKVNNVENFFDEKMDDVKNLFKKEKSN